MCVDTHRPGHTNGRHTQDGRATVHGPGCRCACGASVHAHLHPGFWADAHMWTRPCGVGPAHGFCQAQSTPPPSPLRACRLRQSASAARCGMAPMPTAVTPHAIAPVRKWPGAPLYARLLLHIGHQPRGQPRLLNIPACSICTGMLLDIGHQPRGKPRLLIIPACSIYTGMVLYAQRPPRGKPRLLYIPACSVCTGMLLYIGHPPRGKPRLLFLRACAICTGMLLYTGHQRRGWPRHQYIPS